MGDRAADESTVERAGIHEIAHVPAGAGDQRPVLQPRRHVPELHGVEAPPRNDPLSACRGVPGVTTLFDRLHHRMRTETPGRIA